jgi:hypothetical protein
MGPFAHFDAPHRKSRVLDFCFADLMVGVSCPHFSSLPLIAVAINRTYPFI